jgi:glycosyltransferase involved in cell wall biosynthesis
MKIIIFDEIKYDKPYSYKVFLEYFTQYLKTKGVEYKIITLNWYIPFDRTNFIHLLISAFYRQIIYPIKAFWFFSKDSINCIVAGGLIHLLWVARRGCLLVVFCHDAFPFLSFEILGHKLDFGGKVRQAYLKLIQKRAFFKANLVIVPSMITKMDLVKTIGLEPNRILVIPYKVNLDIFCPGSKEKAREKLGLPLESTLIFCIASPERRKNLETVFRSFKILIDQDTDVKLLLLGPLSTKQQKVLDEFDLNRYVIKLRDLDVNEVVLCYRAADCFVYISLYEGFGYPLLEAMACSCPIICSDRGSIPEVAGEAGKFVEVFNPDSVAMAIHQVLTDKKLRQNLIESGLERVTLFNKESNYSEVLNTLKNEGKIAYTEEEKKRN